MGALRQPCARHWRWENEQDTIKCLKELLMHNFRFLDFQMQVRSAVGWACARTDCAVFGREVVLVEH